MGTSLTNPEKQVTTNNQHQTPTQRPYNNVLKSQMQNVQPVDVAWVWTPHRVCPARHSPIRPLFLQRRRLLLLLHQPENIHLHHLLCLGGCFLPFQRLILPLSVRVASGEPSYVPC